MKTLVMALLIFALSALVLVLSAFTLVPAFADDQIVPFNQIERFAVECVTDPVPNGGISGVILEWDMSSEIGIAQYHLIKDNVTIATVPSNCPGCSGFAQYSYEHNTETPYGVYKLIPDIGTALYQLSTCEIPTAVSLTSFTVGDTE